MKTIDEIEDERADAYQAFDWRELRIWNLDALKTRKEELHYQMDRLRKEFSDMAANAIGTILCEYYDVEEEIELREYEPDPEILASLENWTGYRYTSAKL